MTPCRSSADPICITSSASLFNSDIRVFRFGSSTPSWSIVLPDGTTIAIQIRRWSNVYMLDVTVTATALRNGGLAGLCGTNDRKKNNDLGGKFGNSSDRKSL